DGAGEGQVAGVERGDGAGQVDRVGERHPGAADRPAHQVDRAAGVAQAAGLEEADVGPVEVGAAGVGVAVAARVQVQRGGAVGRAGDGHAPRPGDARGDEVAAAAVE